MDLGFIFKSPDFLHFEEGRLISKSHNNSKRIIIVEQNEKIKISYNVSIFREFEDIETDKEKLFFLAYMRIMEKSQNRIVLQNWSVNEDGEPKTKFGLTVNYVENQVFNCILNLYERRHDLIFLNESELHDPLYVSDYKFYHHYKNGIFTERLMNGHSNEWTFVNNQKHGKWKALLPYGTVSEEGYYKYGEPDGEYINYGGKGHVKYTGNYIQGRRTGLWKYYNNDGIIQLEGNFYDDKEVGKWITYNEKGVYLREKDYGEKGKPLYFKECGGAGNFICRDCGYKEKITSHLHGFTRDTNEASWTSGFQCQTCGTFQTRTSTPSKSVIDLKCECGGQIENEKPLFCPKCRSFDVEYHLTFIT